jgi:hypothetical protein
MKRLMNIALTTGLITPLLTSEAFARRSDREGFNFGVGVRAIGQNDNTSGTETNDDSRTVQQSQAVSPRVGFAFAEHFNLGVAGYLESQDTDQRFTSKDQKRQIDRQSSTQVKAFSLFSRFMFARYMHFEAGFGVYERKRQVEDRFMDKSSDGTFKGNAEVQSTRGIGAGYHVGLGVELPITAGFYFSADYLMRAAQIRDASVDNVIGKKRSRLENRELVFGLAHYVN